MYHLTLKNLGQSVTLKPFASEDRSDTEIDTPRVCASPTIEQCVFALKGCEWFKAKKNENTLCLFVYEIDEKSNFIPYTDVFDFEKTNEHISFNEEPAKLVGVIHIPNSNEAKYLSNKTNVKGTNIVFEKITFDTYQKYYN